MKTTLHFSPVQPPPVIAALLKATHLQSNIVFACTLVWAQVASAAPSTNELYALPDASTAANYVSTLTSTAIPAKESLPLRSRVAVSLIEAGFLVGTTTAVHELGHASRVRAAGGHSNWETGDVNWWTYLSHRDPLGAGMTEWQLPETTSVGERIAITAGGFNATTTWDESVAGKGSYGLLPARFSTLMYEFSGVSADADDLTQIEQLYRTKGYNIPRRELQFWQLLAGCISQTGSPVRMYAYYTPSGVSLRAVTRWQDWTVATEAVVHGTSSAEVEVGRRLSLGDNIELLPKILLSAHGVGGSLKAGGRFGQTTLSLDCRFAPPSTLLGARTTTSFEVNVSTRL